MLAGVLLPTLAASTPGQHGPNSYLSQETQLGHLPGYIPQA